MPPSTCQNGRHARTSTNTHTHPTSGLRYCVDCARERANSTMYARRAAGSPEVPRDWKQAAACQGEDLMLFFGPDGERQPEREVREAKAKEVCAQCPVKTRCLDYAIATPERYGVYGGLAEDERAAERKRRMRRANAGRVAA